MTVKENTSDLLELGLDLKLPDTSVRSNSSGPNNALDPLTLINEVLPRMELGLWLYLDQPERAYAAIKKHADEKKHLVFELLFSEEARLFRETDEFSDLVEEIGLETYWESWRGPDKEL